MSQHQVSKRAAESVLNAIAIAPSGTILTINIIADTSRYSYWQTRRAIALLNEQRVIHIKMHRVRGAPFSYRVDKTRAAELGYDVE
jgi:hypothetical protein